MTGFQFLSVAFAGLASLAIPIFLLYMLRLRRTEISISSNFLWQQLVRDREANAPWQRLRPNLLMLLQLLILAALVLALMRPTTEVKTIIRGRTVVLLDASASMNATDVDGRTRFAAAQALALETVNTLGADDTMTIIRVAEIPEVLVAASRDKSLLRQAIRNAIPSNATGDWQAAFTLASAGGEGVDNLTIVALSDGGLPTNLPEISGEFRYVKIGESSANTGITALSTRALPDDNPQLFARLTNFGDEEAEVILALELDGRLMTANRYTVPAGLSREVVVEDLPEDFHVLKASITSPRNSNVPDYLAIDDTAYAVFNPGGTGDVLVMTARNIFLERLFANLPGAKLTMRTPDEGLPTRDYNLYVFDGWLPESLPTGDLLIINPPQSTNYFTVTGDSTASFIDPDTRGINAESELARYLSFANVSIKQFRTLERTEWATPLVQTQNGAPLVLYGEAEGRQIAIISFALQDSNLPLQITWPILITNLMQWYQPQRAINIEDSVPPGTPLAVRPSVEADNVRITDPDGQTTTLALNGVAEVVYANTDLLGLYEVQVRQGNRVLQEESFAVNLFDPNESNITPADTIQIPTRTGLTVFDSNEGENVGRREWWNYLAILGLLLLLGEWWYYQQSKGKIRRRASRLAYQASLGNSTPEKPRPWWRFWSRSA